jgi:hypothetical protein
MQQDNIITIKFKKQGKKLIPVGDYGRSQYEEFVGQMEEDQEVQVFFEAHKDDGTVPQLAMIHTCIRKLALETGYTFEGMKLEIKQRSGLIYGSLNSSEGYAKSFGDCSKEELALVMEALKEAGEMVNLQF